MVEKLAVLTAVEMVLKKGALADDQKAETSVMNLAARKVVSKVVEMVVKLDC